MQHDLLFFATWPTSFTSIHQDHLLPSKLTYLWSTIFHTSQPQADPATPIIVERSMYNEVEDKTIGNPRGVLNGRLVETLISTQ